MVEAQGKRFTLQVRKLVRMEIPFYWEMCLCGLQVLAQRQDFTAGPAHGPENLDDLLTRLTKTEHETALGEKPWLPGLRRS